jgi:hypothetical protein
MAQELYEDYFKACTELGYPTVETYLTRKIIAPDGSILKSVTDRAHSWCRCAFNILLSNLGSVNIDDTSFGAGYLSIREPDGDIFYHNRTVTTYSYSAPAGDTSYGIVVGTSNAGYSFDDYKLWNQISHGISSGSLCYWDTVRTSSFIDSNSKYRSIISRYFNNNSGGDVTVNEVGLVAAIYYSSGSSYYSSVRALMSRDVLETSDVLQNAFKYYVEYTMITSYPS